MQTNDIEERLEMQHLVDEEEVKEEDAATTFLPIPIRTWKPYPYLGIILGVISSMFYSLASVIVKCMVNVHPIQLSVFRFTGILLPAIPIVIWRNDNPFPKGKRLLQFLRSFIGTISFMLSFYAFRHMPLADASVMIFSIPVFVAIFARLFLKEPCGLFQFVSILLTLLGEILVTRPPLIFGSSELSKTDVWGPVAAFSSTILTANVFIMMRNLKDVHYSVILANFGTLGVIISLTTTWGLDELCWPQCGIERLLTVALALVSFAGQSLLAIALQLEQAGPVAIARTSDIVFAFIWQIVIFQEVPNLYSIVGAFLVAFSVFLSGIKTWLLALPETSMLRKTFSIFEM